MYELVEGYYKRIRNLTNFLQHWSNKWLSIDYFIQGWTFNVLVAIVFMKWDALIQHLEAALICEKNSIIMQTIIKSFWMLYPMMKGNGKRTNKSSTRNNKQKEECQYCKNKWGECVSRWENQIIKQIKDVWHPFPWMWFTMLFIGLTWQLSQVGGFDFHYTNWNVDDEYTWLFQQFINMTFGSFSKLQWTLLKPLHV